MQIRCRHEDTTWHLLGTFTPATGGSPGHPAEARSSGNSSSRRTCTRFARSSPPSPPPSSAPHGVAARKIGCRWFRLLSSCPQPLRNAAEIVLGRVLLGVDACDGRHRVPLPSLARTPCSPLRTCRPYTVHGASRQHSVRPPVPRSRVRGGRGIKRAMFNPAVRPWYGETMCKKI